jgi:diguanylate cyclase (GGDEF)-like protein/PAS domain S-box-containing protein
MSATSVEQRERTELPELRATRPQAIAPFRRTGTVAAAVSNAPEDMPSCRFVAGEGSFGARRTLEHQRFWSSYLRLGLVVLCAESIGTLVYFVLTPNGSHRTLLIAMAGAFTAIALGNLSIVERIAARNWRAEFSLTWTLLSGVVLTTVCFLDGGIDSPLVYLLVLPIASAALGLSVYAVIACGLATLLELFLVWISDPLVSRLASDMAMFSLVLVGLVTFAIGFARSRTRLQSAQVQLEDELAFLAETDLLTGCLNHGAFYLRLEGEINRALRAKSPLSLLMVDIDLFKAFNDSHGHVAGDHALAEVGSTLKNLGRSFDIVGRVGGDEFAVILPATSLAEASSIADRVAKALEHPNGNEMTASVGYSELDPEDPSAKRLVRDADAGLYEAKSDGRDRAARAVRHLSKSVTEETARLKADNRLTEERVREADRATAEALSILDAYQSTSSVGLGFVDREFRILRVNPMLASVNGGRPEDQLGRTVEEVVPRIWPQLEEVYRRVIDTNTPSANVEVSGETAADPGRVHSWLTNLYPVRVAGEVIGIGVVVVDITDRKALEESQASLTRAVVDALANAVEMRDPYTDGHQGRVAQLARELAIDLGVEREEVDAIELAARIHDVGKIVVPAEILSKPGQLSDAEHQLVQQHAQAGSDLLARSDFPDHVREMVLQHHERLDGSGYPRGLTAEHISTGARIIAVADVFDAMSTNRPYRPALDVELVIRELEDGAGRLYDSDAVAACLRRIALDRSRPVDDTHAMPMESELHVERDVVLLA